MGHPWNPKYALPKNVRDEKLGGGVIVTRQARRGTIDILKGLKATNKYALPANVLDEIPGKGTIATRWAPRGTISSLYKPTIGVGGLGSLGSDGLGSLGEAEEKPTSSDTTVQTVATKEYTKLGVLAGLSLAVWLLTR